MDKDQKIFELTKYTCLACEMNCDGQCIEGNDCSQCYIAIEGAEKLYNDGYARSTEIAREIFEELNFRAFCNPLGHFLLTASEFREIREKYEGSK